MIRIETDHDYRAEELEQQADARNYKMIHAIMARDYGDEIGHLYTKHIMEFYPYQTMTLREIMVLPVHFQICAQCGEVTEDEAMHDGEWDDDVCEWCWESGR